jgi:hypothetical protein
MTVEIFGNRGNGRDQLGEPKLETPHALSTLER